MTFRQLDEASDRLAKGLQRIGLRRGDRTVLMVPPGLDFFTLTFALFKLGGVIVLIDPGLGPRRLGQCLNEVAPRAFIGVGRAHLARTLLGWARRSLRIRVTVGRRRFPGTRGWDELWRAEEPRFPLAETSSDETAAILFTSGATGPPKGAVYTHGMFWAQLTSLRRHFGMRPGEVDVATFPLFALFDAGLGATAVIPRMNAGRPASADPRLLVAAIEDHGATRMFASPALLDRLARYAEARRLTLRPLRRLYSAGAPVRPDILERLRRVLPPRAEIHTPYGATEALPVADVESREILRRARRATARGAGICVGRPLPHVRLRLIRIVDGPIARWSPRLEVPAGAVGEIVVRGPVVSPAYYARDGMNGLAKIPGRNGRAFYHRMGDLGRFDPKGGLWFCGRKAHRVVTRSGLLLSDCCEGIFNAHPAVFRTALVGVGPPGDQTPVLCVELEPGARPADRESLRRELLERASAHPMTRSIRAVLFHNAFPVDRRHNAKIDRPALARWAARRLR